MNNKTNMKKEKKNYESPQLTVVEFRVERGFAGSDNIVYNAAQNLNLTLETEMLIQAAKKDSHGNIIAAEMEGNVDNSNAGGSSNWQYSNGGWF
jgi:hypothetical protein